MAQLPSRQLFFTSLFVGAHGAQKPRAQDVYHVGFCPAADDFSPVMTSIGIVTVKDVGQHPQEGVVGRVHQLPDVVQFFAIVTTVECVLTVLAQLDRDHYVSYATCLPS